MKERIKEIREVKHMTQAELANILGLTRACISQMECGKQKITPRTIDQLCNNLQVNREWLLKGRGLMFTDTPENSNIVSEDIKKEYHLTDEHYQLVIDFCKLTPVDRQKICNFYNSIKNIDFVQNAVDFFTVFEKP